MSLALGIGANTAIFTLIDAVLLELLPVRDPQQLVLMSWSARERPEGVVRSLSGSNSREPGRYSSTSFSFRVFEAIRSRNQAFATVFGFAPLGRVNLVADGQAGLAEAQLASADYFSGLGVRTILGRAFGPNDDRPAATPVVVIGYAYWQRRFGGDASVLGKTVTLNGLPCLIVGVTEPQFRGHNPGGTIDVTVPLSLVSQVIEDRLKDRGHLVAGDYWWMLMMGRLKPGVSAEAARPGLDVIFKQAATDSVEFPKGKPRIIPSLEIGAGGQGLDFIRRRFQKPLYILMSVVVVVLLISCANVANLLLARATLRQKEIALRLALGTTRGRLVRQLLTEGLLLAALGGALGLLFAYWGSRSLVMLMSDRNPITLDLTPDLRILGFTGVASLLTSVLFGLAPALRATRLHPFATLRESSGGSSGGRLRLGLAKGLVVSQVALSLVLLVGAGLFVRTLVNLKNVEVGFEREGVLLFGVNPSQAGYKGVRLAEFAERIQQQLERLPGVTSASMSRHLLLSGGGSSRSIARPGRTKQDEDTTVAEHTVGSRFFETMRIPLLYGRGFEAQDDENAPKVAIVNEAMVREFVGTDPPIGRTFELSRTFRGQSTIEIVGVVKDAMYESLRGTAPATIYLPLRQRLADIGTLYFEARTTGDARALMAGARRAVESIDKSVPLFDVKTQTQQIDELLLQERLFAKLIGFFGGLALLLAAVGVYGLLSYSVAKRTGEIGIRMALGARRRDVLAMVLRETLLLIGSGTLVGIAAAYVTARLAASVISGLLFGLQPTDLGTIGLSVAVMGGVAALAGLLPARRASGVDPIVALRHE